MELIFATNNAHKVYEINAALGDAITIISLEDAGIDIEIPEPHNTLEANALEKSTVIHRLTGRDCFSEDSGLHVAALSGAPGVHSARYAGEDADSRKNIELLLRNMQDVADRSAYFKTVISLILKAGTFSFSGECPGKIIEAPSGDSGFGYDPIFIPAGADRTFAQMSVTEKNVYSHRRKALDKLTAFLKDYHA